jgi:glucose/arabinose dehydrogenase
MRAKPSLLGACLLLIAVAAPAQTLPTNFFNDALVTTGLTEPSGMCFLPDGRILVCEQRTAAIKVWAGGATMSTLGTVPGVNSSGNEQGVLSVVADASWPARPYIYVWFDSNASSNLHLAMFTVSGDVSIPTSTNLTLGAQYNIITDVPDVAPNHNGGSLRFGNDGKLYLSIGDDASGCPAQDPSSFVGCVLRLDVSSLPGVGAGPPAKSTLIPAGNPFSGPTDNARLCWAYGLRNPFRFHIDPVTGWLYIADVGQNLWEEVDECTTGGQNFGWPWLEGNAAYSTCTGTQPSSVAPIVVWPHSGSAAIIGLGRYRNPVSGAWAFGSSYEGDYFYTDYYYGIIRRLKWTGSAWVTPAQVAGQPNATDWATGFASISDAARGPDGALYYLKQFGPGSLNRIRSNPNAPTLSIVSGNNQPGNAGRALSNPLVARLMTVSGSPIANTTVNFIVTAGGGSVNPASVLTDSQGYAQTAYTMGATYLGNPTINATSSGATAVTFSEVWRGLTVSYSSAFNFISITVRHSQTNSPVTLCWQTPPPTGPYVTTNWGSVWTSVLSPVAGFGALDGLGLLGPPNPAIRTPANSTTWTYSASGLPPQGMVPFLFQAYAVDTSLYPTDPAFMISNTVTVTIN